MIFIKMLRDFKIIINLIEHLQENAVLKAEINAILDANPDKIQTAYKIIRALAD